MNSYSQKLKLAGLEVCRLENELFSRYENVDVIIPPRTDANIKRIIASYYKKQHLKQSVIKVASIAIVFTIIGSLVFTINVEAREKAKALLRKVFGSTIEYTPDTNTITDNSSILLKSVELKWLPEGFELKDSYEDKDSKNYYYKNSNDAILIRCAIIREYTDLGYYSPDNYKVQTEIGSYNGLYYEYIYSNEFSSQNNLLIVDDINKYYITIDSTLDKNAMFKLYDNLEIEFYDAD